MKKKGLIISTIVMVLVLAVSLSTATFAWFSTQATATVTDLNINTKASEGLQIAMVNGSINDRWSGQLEFANNKWSGEANDWGSQLNLANINIGDMEDAVTKIPSGTTLGTIKTTYAGKSVLTGYTAVTAADTALASGNVNADTVYYVTVKKTISLDVKFKYGEDYTASANPIAVGTTFTKANSAAIGDIVYSFTRVEDPTANVTNGNAYCTATYADWATVLADKLSGANDTDTLNEDVYLVPVAYDLSTQPTAFTLATANNHYYYLTMAVTNMKAVNELGFSIEIVPGGSGTFGTGGTGADARTYPGMTAASRMDVTVSAATADGAPDAAKTVTKNEAPFGAWKGAANGTQTKRATNNIADLAKDGVTAANYNADGKYAYLINPGDGSDLPAGSVFYVTILIYIEGEDFECSNATAGTEMTFSINFGYTEGAGNTITWADAKYFKDGTFVTDGGVNAVRDLFPASAP